MENQGNLTRYSIGSLKELFTISFPLMLSLSSVAIMIFFDRFFLSYLSQAAFSASSEAATFFIIFDIALISIAATSEVYVGRLYGARKYDHIAKPCWAMLWLSVASAIILFPVAEWGGAYFFKNSCYPVYSEKFFRSLTYFTPLFGINMALASFWIGRGKTVFVTFATITANILNIALDPILIFGKWGFPRLEIEGAGIATGISQFVQMCIYLYAFLHVENRKMFKTAEWRLDVKILRDCCSLGGPIMFSSLLQTSAWSTIANMMSQAGSDYLLVWGVIHTSFSLFAFLGDAVGKSSTAIVSNCIGAGKTEAIPQIIRSGVTLHIIFFSLFLLLFSLFSEEILSLFIQDFARLTDSLRIVLYNAMWWNLILAFVEALLFLSIGVLIALGDSYFISWTGSILIWIVAVLPAKYIIKSGLPADRVISITIWYYLIMVGLSIYRLRKHKKKRTYEV